MGLEVPDSGVKTDTFLLRGLSSPSVEACK